MEFGIFGWWLLLAALFQLSSIHGCLREEREALLQFKPSLNSSYDPSTSWNTSHGNNNCCEWERVVCDNTTGHVIELDLSYYNDFELGLNASLFIPFQELKYLDLGRNGISGWAPNEGFERLSRLSKLEVLKLDQNYINESFLSSLGQILYLKKLYLRNNLLDRPINFPISGQFPTWLLENSTSNLEKTKLATRIASRDDSPTDSQLPSSQSLGLYKILHRQGQERSTWTK
ncbi:hypothetical protein I3843_15G094200 [Carya illinoinensis]|nr:hypothetical protein I3843_15G094200 [Carya illinoinensis]